MGLRDDPVSNTLRPPQSHAHAQTHPRHRRGRVARRILHPAAGRAAAAFHAASAAAARTGGSQRAVSRSLRQSAAKPPPQQPTRPGEYPTATRTANPNEVISPYEPYNVIDVEGFRSGQLARDPSNNQIFRVP